MADADRLVAALNYLQEQKPADPLESFRSLAGLKDAYERRVQPIINNARQTFSTGGAMGDLLRSYGDAAAPGNAAALQGMGIPFKGPMTAPREEGFSSGENFRPMGDPQQQFAGQLLGDPMNVQPMIAPAARGAVAAGKYAGPELARGLENYMVKSGGILPMDVWHGSPHRFPPTAKNPLGEFDASKIGTGEGAQAYGHGLYFAEDKDLANVYRRKLTGGDGSPVAHPDQSIQVQIGRLQNQVKQLEQSGDASAPAMIKAYQNRIAELDRAGNLYKVDLPDEQIAKMLDYDKPLSQQPEALKTIRGLVPADMLKTFDANVKGGISGANAYKNYIPSQSYAIRDAGATNYKPSAAKTFEDALAEVGGDTSRLRVINDRSEAKVSEMLRAQGIPGIRYLDEGSRAAGEGTSNFVVFDPAHMNILERNGVTAASLRNVAPQDEALRLAQQRAALPVEQHGLGLPADNTPQQRAAAMGAEFGWGHGSNNPDITTFKPSKTGAQGPGIYATNYLPETNMYSSLKDTGNTSYPLAVFKDEALISKLNNPYDELKVAADDELISELFKRNKSAIITNQEPTPDWLLKQGVSEYPERQHYVSVNPDNFRSRFAAFDPWRRNSALAASLGVAAPDLLAQENK